METQTCEYKREYADTIKNTVVAFANTQGGTIYVGVGDDGSIYGVEDVDETLLRLSNMLRDSIRPDVTMFVQYHIQDRAGKTVIALEVQQGTARPYYLAAKGIRPEGVYVRQGPSSVPASAGAILDMIKEASGYSYETGRSMNQDLSFEKASQVFDRCNLAFGPQQWRTLGLVSPQGTYTNLGLLLSDQCKHSLRLALFQGSTKTAFRDRQEVSGSVLDQLEQAYAWLDRYNGTQAGFSGLYRTDYRDYPEEALREALLNAIAHRDYSFAGSTLVSIYDDRLEVVSLGGLYGGLTYDDLMLGISSQRNPNLANVLYRLGLIEAYGTGIAKIFGSYVGHTVKPLVELSDHVFKVTLPNRNFVPAQLAPVLTDRQQKVLDLAPVTRKQVQEALNVSQSTANSLLRNLVDLGLLTQAGAGRNTVYEKTVNFANNNHYYY